MPIQPRGRVEVTHPSEGFEHLEGETGTVVHVTGDYVHIEDEGGHRSTHHRDELTIRPA